MSADYKASVLLVEGLACRWNLPSLDVQNSQIAEARELSTASADSMQAQIVNITNDTFEGSKLRTDRMKIQDTPRG